MMTVNILCKPAMCQLCRNMKSSYANITSMIIVILLAGTVTPSAALELCGGIRGRFVCDDQDPTVFHICLGNNQYTMNCPGTLHFNLRTQNCDWPDSVNCVQEAMSRKANGAFSTKLVPSPITINPDDLVAIHHDSSASKARSPRPPSISSLPAITALNNTEGSFNAPEVPDLETPNPGTQSSRYRLKVVPGINKPLETLLPGDEKVIEEVKKLSEELKHIDNYLQSLESDQVGFMIEPYMAKFSPRRRTYPHSYVQAKSSEEPTPFASPYENGLSQKASPFKKRTSANSYAMTTADYHHSRPINTLTPKTSSKVVSAEPKSRSPYKPPPMLYSSTAYKRHNIPTTESRYMPTNKIPKVELDNNSFQKKNVPLKVNETYKPPRRNFHPSTEVGTTRLPEMHTIYSPHQTTDNLFPTHRPFWILDKPQKSHTSTAPKFDHTRSSSNRTEQPIKYSATDYSRITQSSSQQLQGRVTSRMKQNDVRTSNLPMTSTTWWSKPKPSYYSTSPFPQRRVKVTETSSTQKYTNPLHKSNKPSTNDVFTSTTVTVRPESPKWWSSMQPKNKSTTTTNVPRRQNRRKYKPRNYIPKRNYNTRSDDVTLALIPSHQRSSSYMSSAKNDQPIDAAAALEPNVAPQNALAAPAMKERTFVLHDVNSAASADRIVLHNPYFNGRQKNKAVSQSDKLFALHKSGDLKTISAYKSPVEKYETKKAKCSSAWCKLPDCRCIGPTIPGDLNLNDVPQMVMLTFDDSVNGQNMHYYRRIFNGTRRNPNGCPIKSTFFVSGDNSDYVLVKRIYKQGHEIASHTMSHRDPTTWWAHAGFENWEREVVGMRDRLHDKSGVPAKEINGMRAPFLQVGGDAQYAMLKENMFRYDSSMVTGNLFLNNKPPIWPFTLDTPPDGETCNLTPCPTRSYPGLWEVPLIRWYGSDRVACAMPDACTTDLGSKGSLKFLQENFNRHYKSNRAPFGIFIHASWFGRKDGNFQGLFEFLSSLAGREDVWLVTVNQALDWIQHPVKLSDLGTLKSWRC